MSAIDVERGGWSFQQATEYPHHHKDKTSKQNVTTDSPLPRSTSPQSPPELVDDAAFKQEVADAVAERDAFWRKHERTQIAFVQEECQKLMAKMHRELERLHMANRDVERRLYVEPKQADEMAQLKRDLSAERQNCAELRHELGLSVKRNAKLAQMLEKSAHIHKEQVKQYEDKLAELHEQIRRLNGLLLSKSKCRSIGPTMARFGPVRRSQSGDSRADGGVGRVRSQSEMISPEGSTAEQLGIDARPAKKHSLRIMMMRNPSPAGSNNSTQK